jgi:hypothetical protein
MSDFYPEVCHLSCLADREIISEIPTFSNHAIVGFSRFLEWWMLMRARKSGQIGFGSQSYSGAISCRGKYAESKTHNSFNGLALLMKVLHLYVTRFLLHRPPQFTTFERSLCKDEAWHARAALRPTTSPLYVQMSTGDCQATHDNRFFLAISW